MPEADGRAFVFLPCAAGVEAFLGEEACGLAMLLLTLNPKGPSAPGA